MFVKQIVLCFWKDVLYLLARGLSHVDSLVIRGRAECPLSLPSSYLSILLISVHFSFWFKINVNLKHEKAPTKRGRKSDELTKSLLWVGHFCMDDYNAWWDTAKTAPNSALPALSCNWTVIATWGNKMVNHLLVSACMCETMNIFKVTLKLQHCD